MQRRDWKAKDIAQSQLDFLTKEENKLSRKYGLDWKIKASKEELNYIYELEDRIDWGQLD